MSGLTNPSTPSLAGFTAFVYGAMGVPTVDLPTDSPFIGYAYNVAKDIVHQVLCLTPLLYTLAVYNLGGDMLVRFTPDQPGQVYFKTLRGPAPDGFGINNFVPGVVTAAADVSTSDSLVTPEFMKSLTLSDLANLKTPWGRRYLEIAQWSGTLWGIT